MLKTQHTEPSEAPSEDQWPAYCTGNLRNEGVGMHVGCPICSYIMGDSSETGEKDW